MESTAEGPQASGAGTLTQLREWHIELLGRWTGDNPPADEAEALRQAGQALGACLDDPEDRDRAQGIIDYWTATLSAIPDRPFPEMLRLAPFEPSRPQTLAEAGEAMWQKLEPGERDAAEKILLRLVTLGRRGTVLACPTVPRSRLIGKDGGDAATAALRSLTEAGVVRCAGDDRFDLSHASLARHWPRLAALLSQQHEADRTRDRLLATAEQWELHGKNPGYLLTGNVLDQAKLYIGQDETLDAFILESSRRRDRSRRLWLASVTLGPLLLALVLVGDYYLSYYRGVSGEADRQIEVQETGDDDLEDKLEKEEERPATAASSALPAATRTGLGRTGFIWAGNEADRLLRDYRTREIADPAQLSAGRILLARADLALRRSGPIDDDRAGPQVGVVPAGVSVVVLSQKPATQNRRSGTQYWVQVRVIPQVSIRFATGKRERAQALESELRKAGFDVHRSERTRNASGLRELRYFHAVDEPSAKVLHAAATAALGPIACRPRLNSARTSESKLELWIDFDLSLVPSPEGLQPSDC